MIVSFSSLPMVSVEIFAAAEEARHAHLIDDGNFCCLPLRKRGHNTKNTPHPLV